MVSADVQDSQREGYHTWYRALGSEKDGFAMLEAEDPMVIRKMTRALQQGHFLLVYVDGNMGSPGARESSRLIVDFLAHKIRVRTGVAEVSRLARVPIYPVLTRFDESLQPQVDVLQRVEPFGSSPDKIAWTQQTMQLIYQPLANAVGRDPMQWEGWFYVHGDMVCEEHQTAHDFFRYYLPFKLGNYCFLLHKDSFKAYHLPQRLYDRLSKFVLS